MSETTINEYWQRYSTSSTPVRNLTSYSGWTCSYCGCWVSSGETHICYSYCPYYWPHYWPYYSTSRNKKSEAFEIIKILVKEKIIPEPDYKTFVSLLEKIAEKI